jgi:uncharacterized protein
MLLFDGNLLLALTIDTHEFHQRAQRWFVSQVEPFATCAITEGTLLRVHMKVAQDTSAAAAWSVLEAVHAMPITFSGMMASVIQKFSLPISPAQSK